MKNVLQYVAAYDNLGNSKVKFVDLPAAVSTVDLCNAFTLATELALWEQVPIEWSGQPVDFSNNYVADIDMSAFGTWSFAPANPHTNIYRLQFDTWNFIERSRFDLQSCAYIVSADIVISAPVLVEVSAPMGCGLDSMVNRLESAWHLCSYFAADPDRLEQLHAMITVYLLRQDY